MGVRTFPLVSLLGTISAYTSEIWLSVLLGAFSLGLILIGYLRSSQKADADFGLTTETAAAVVFPYHRAPTTPPPPSTTPAPPRSSGDAVFTAPVRCQRCAGGGLAGFDIP